MPDWKREIGKYLQGLNLSPTREAEIIEELSQHLEDRYQELLATGMNNNQACSAALDETKNGRLQQEIRRVEREVRIEPVIFGARRKNILGAMWQDLRFGVRMLVKSPGFTAVALLSLALGIGANTAIFQLIDAVRMRALPVNNPNELAVVQMVSTKGRRGSVNTSYPAVTNLIWEQIRDRQQSFSGIFAWAAEDFDISPGGESHSVAGAWVSGDFFNVLGVKPAVGRVFSESDDRKGCAAPGAVISYSFWQHQYGGDPSIIGKKISLNHSPVDIIGVTEKEFFGLEVGQSYDVAVPICWQPTLQPESNIMNSSTSWWLTVIGRLKPGVSLGQASSQLNAISPAVFESSIRPDYPQANVNDYLAFRLSADTAANGVSWLRYQFTNPLWILLAIAGLVLLIACANLANLMLARASSRKQEIAVRLALGASRARLVNQLLTESLLLATVGALLGIFLAGFLSEFLVRFMDTKVILGTDWRVIGFTVGTAILTCILFGLAPAIRATGININDVIKAGSRSMSSSRESASLRRILVVSQVALSLMLLVGALLFTRTLRNLSTVDAGFRQDGILIASIDMSKLNIPVERRRPFTREMLEKVRSIRMVDSVSEALTIPVSGNESGNALWMDGSTPNLEDDTLIATVGADYFRTMGTSLLAGREFNDHDTADSPKVAIVNEAFAKKYTNAQNPVGKRFWRQATPRNPETEFEIVGMVRNSKYVDLREDFQPIAFLSGVQNTRAGLNDQFVVHSNAPLADVTTAFKTTIATISPDISIDFQPFKKIVNNSIQQEQLMATLSGFFGALAFLLATIGLYGVMSYTVAQRTHDMGIRVALGASRRRIIGMVLGESAIMVLIGLSIGGALAAYSAKAASSMLFGLKPYDPTTFAMAMSLLAAVAIIASYIPARRAAGVDPMIALRSE